MNVQKFLRDRGIWFESIEHKPTFDAFSLAETVNVVLQEVAKPVLLRVDDGYVLVVLPASKSVDLMRIRQLLQAEHVELASEADCGHEFVDCEFGARLPFGSQYGLRTLMDESLRHDDEIVFEGNTHREAIRMKRADYVALEKPWVVQIAQSFG
jgi:Ala-tRNA(Pro) deacylase